MEKDTNTVPASDEKTVPAVPAVPAKAVDVPAKFKKIVEEIMIKSKTAPTPVEVGVEAQS